MEEIRFILNNLNEEPFNKKLNVISYDNLRPEQRVEILFQIFHRIDPTMTVPNIQLADPEELVIQILEMLRICKYQPPPTVKAGDFRQNILSGERDTYTNVFHFLFERMSELPKRAYLAKYLVKVEVSPDLEGDSDIVDLYGQYEELIEKFKTVHATYETLKNNIDSVQEIQRDLKAMEIEKDQLDEKLSNMKRKEHVNSHPRLLEQIQLLNEERLKHEKMQKQRQQTEQEIESIVMRLQQLESEQREMESVYTGDVEPQEVIRRLEEEVQAKQHLVDEILVHETNSLSEYIRELEQLDAQSQSSGPAYLNGLQDKIQSLTGVINQELERQMLSDEPDDQLAVYRQNTSISIQKIAALESEVKNLEQQLNEIDHLLEDKKTLQEEILVGDALKQYMNDVRTLGNEYKLKKQQLSDLQSEAEVLNNTLQELNEQSVKLEKEQSLAGLLPLSATAQEEEDANSNGLDEEEELDDQQLNERIQSLNQEINERKSKLTSMVQQVKPLRLEHQELKRRHEEGKANYDAVAAGLEMKLNELELANRDMSKHVQQTESECFRLDTETQLLRSKLEWIQDNQVDNGENQLIAKLNAEIESEMATQQATEQRMEKLKGNEQLARKQNRLWSDLIRLLNVKQECLAEEQQKQQQPIKQTTDHLVL